MKKLLKDLLKSKRPLRVRKILTTSSYNLNNIVQDNQTPTVKRTVNLFIVNCKL